MKIVFFILFTAISGAFHTFSQDIHFSQMSQNPLWINPAITGVYKGWERVSISHRSQWLGATTQFQTTAISADVNLLKTKRNDKAHLGFGIMFWNDVGGDANYGQRQGSISLSGIVPMGGGNQLSAGIQAGIGARGGNMSDLVFESQWNGDFYDPTFASGEGVSLQSENFYDLSLGVNYLYDGESTSFARNEDLRFQAGFAVFHANQPEIRYAGIANDFLFRKFVAHTSFITDVRGTRWSAEANAVALFQGPQNQIILGGLMRYRISQGSKITGLKQDAYLAGGLFFRAGDALIPTVQLDYKGFLFGISYDATVSQLNNAYRGGSLEFSIVYRNLNHALFKKRRY
jgi:type IX secretion system PorP/SprF family membrane protein